MGSTFFMHAFFWIIDSKADGVCGNKKRKNGKRKSGEKMREESDLMDFAAIIHGLWKET